MLIRLSEEHVDEDPLVGKGPLPYKNIIDYLGYHSVSDFTLPGSIDETMTLFGFTTKWKVVWEKLNIPVSEDLFRREVSDRKRGKFRTADIGGGLWVMEQFDKIQHSRFLVQVRGKNKLTLIGAVSNNKEFNQSVLDEMEKQFPGYEIDGLFDVRHRSGVLSLTGFFAKKAYLYAPTGIGFFAEEKGFMNSAEDSAWHQFRSNGRVNTFDKAFKTARVTAIILNPVIKDDFSQYDVCYYLPEEKVMYYQGNPYSARSDSGKSNPREKALYELIKSRKLAVGKIVFSGAFLNDAPLFMPFDEFERRVQNTDFTIYEK